METRIVTLVFVLWLVGLVTLPLWLYPIGRRGARLRERLEAPHRHPRPAVDVLAPRLTPSADARALAFRDGLAATAGARPRWLEEVPTLLHERHGTVAEVEETPAHEQLYRVTLTGGSGHRRVAGGAVCEYDRGVVSGLFEALAGGSVDVTESVCGARGAPGCVFHVRVERPLPRVRGSLLARARILASRWLGRMGPSGSQVPARGRAAGAAQAAPAVHSSRRRS